MADKIENTRSSYLSTNECNAVWIITTYLFFCIITNKSTITINLQITRLLHVSTLSCHVQGARIHYLAKLHK
jgi:hypothetical protein